jgi:hypothetical protein
MAEISSHCSRRTTWLHWISADVGISATDSFHLASARQVRTASRHNVDTDDAMAMSSRVVFQ